MPQTTYTRPQKPLSIKIKNETLKGKLNDIRNKKIDFDKDINVLALEQGIGKTHRCIEYIEDNAKTKEPKKILYLTNKQNKTPSGKFRALQLAQR